MRRKNIEAKTHVLSTSNSKINTFNMNTIHLPHLININNGTKCRYCMYLLCSVCISTPNVRYIVEMSIFCVIFGFCVFINMINITYDGFCAWILSISDNLFFVCYWCNPHQ